MIYLDGFYLKVHCSDETFLLSECRITLVIHLNVTVKNESTAEAKYLCIGVSNNTQGSR